MTKKKKNVNLENALVEKPKKKRSTAYSKNKGSRYEQQIAKELRELGFPGCKTSRSESKATDDNKVDIIDTENKLPCSIQLKKTQVTPQYFNIRSQSTVDPETFCIIWNKQEKKETNICSVGECVIIDKNFFYKLIKNYVDGKSGN